jgi:SAM-dependent methyltransferase
MARPGDRRRHARGAVGVTESTAAVEGPEWSARADAWVELWAGLAAPAREAVATAAAIGPGARVLDVACGSGEFCALAAGRGAEVSGIDAAEGMIAIARRRLPGADLRVGPMESLPWADGTFDAVTAFNALQFAADFVTALREAARVARPGGRVAVCNWGRTEDRELSPILRALGELLPPAPDSPPAPAVGEAGVLEELARAAGLAPGRAGEVETPYEVADLATLERALVVGAGFHPAVGHAGERSGERGGRRRRGAVPPPRRLVPLREPLPLPDRRGLSPAQPTSARLSAR